MSTSKLKNSAGKRFRRAQDRSIQFQRPSTRLLTISMNHVSPELISSLRLFFAITARD